MNPDFIRLKHGSLLLNFKQIFSQATTSLQLNSGDYFDYLKQKSEFTDYNLVQICALTDSTIYTIAFKNYK